MEEYKLKLLLEGAFAPDLTRLNEQRKKLVKRVVCVFVFLGVPLAVYIIKILLLLFEIYLNLPFIYEGPYSSFVFMGMFITFVVLPYVWINPGIADYRKEYKERFLKPLITRFVHPSLKYLAQEGVSEEVFIWAGFFPITDKLKSEDKIAGKIGTTAIEFSEITPEVEYDSDSDSNRFTGLLFSAQFDKHFNAKTYVLMKSAKNRLLYKNKSESEPGGGRRLSSQSINPSDWPLVTLEDTQFNRIFKVYSKDPVEARRILSLALAKRMVEFQKRIKSTIRMSFVKNWFFIAINTGGITEGPLWFLYLFQQQSLFDPKIFGSVLDYNKLEKHIDDYRMMIDMVEILQCGDEPVGLS